MSKELYEVLVWLRAAAAEPQCTVVSMGALVGEDDEDLRSKLLKIDPEHYHPPADPDARACDALCDGCQSPWTQVSICCSERMISPMMYVHGKCVQCCGGENHAGRRQERSA